MMGCRSTMLWVVGGWCINDETSVLSKVVLSTTPTRKPKNVPGGHDAPGQVGLLGGQLVLGQFLGAAGQVSRRDGGPLALLLLGLGNALATLALAAACCGFGCCCWWWWRRGLFWGRARGQSSSCGRARVWEGGGWWAEACGGGGAACGDARRQHRPPAAPGRPDPAPHQDTQHLLSLSSWSWWRKRQGRVSGGLVVW